VPDGESGDTVSREAFDRVKHDLEQIKAEKAQFTSASQQFLLTDTAYEHFKAKGDVPDPYGAAKAAARDSMLVGVEKDALPEKLDAWLDSFKAVFGSTNGSSSDGDGDGEPPPATPPPPGSARPAPSPANSGGDPKPEPLTMTSPEVQELRKRGDREGLRQLVKEGRLTLSPDNPYGSKQQ
jgi:hypothetical protein